MGLLTNLIFSVIHFIFIALDITSFFIVVRLLCDHRRLPWLERFNSLGKPLSDAIGYQMQTLVCRVSGHTVSQNRSLIIALLAAVILRTLLVVILST
jgi:hypothetical protein